MKLTLVLLLAVAMCSCDRGSLKVEAGNPFSNDDVKSFVIFAPYRSAEEFEKHAMSSTIAKKLSELSESRENFWIAYIGSEERVIQSHELKFRPRPDQRRPAVIVFDKGD